MGNLIANNPEIGNTIKLDKNVTLRTSDKENLFNWSFLLFLPLFAYIFLIISFTLYDSIKNKDAKAIFILPLIYSTIHISYGAGMIYGYVKNAL